MTGRAPDDATTTGGPTPVVTVIVPVHDGSGVLRACLDGLVASDLPRDRWELVVVDDGSRDDSAAIATALADRVLRVEGGPRGPAHARNLGAAAARAPLLCFIDADVVVAPHTLRGLVAPLESDATLTALFGSYDASPADPGTVSQYRNLLHRFMHATHAGEAETFWAGCGIVRRDAFMAVGGFDAARFPRPQVEDIALGYRLRDAGGRIRLDPSLTGTHLKRWTFRGMVRTDLVDRAVPWTRLLLERGTGLGHAPLNLGLRQKLLTACAAAALLAAPLALVPGLRWSAAIVVAGIAAMVLGNLPLFAFFARRHGAGFALRAIPLQCIHHCVGAVGATWALVTRPTLPLRPERWSAAAVGAAAVLLALHAWLAWSVRIPTLTTGGDDATLLDLARAISEGSYRELWLSDAPTHAKYPPGYPLALALLGATGIAQLPLAIAANVAASVVALACAAVLAGRIAPWLGVAALLVLAPNPALVDSAGRVMSEPLFTALLLATFVALPRSDRGGSAGGGGAATRFAVAGACAIGAALTRSIGVALVLALLLDRLLDGRWRQALLFGAASALTVGAWLGWTVRAQRLDVGSSYIADVAFARASEQPTPTGPEGGSVTSVPASAPPTSFGALLGERVRRNVPGYLTRAIPDVLAQPALPDTPVDNLLGLALTLLLGAAGTIWLVRRERTVVLALASYAAVLLVWPYQFSRFLLPVLPLLALLLLVGAWRVAARVGVPGHGAPVVGAFAVVLALFALPPSAARQREVGACDRNADVRRSLTCVTGRQRDFFAAVEQAASLAPGTPLLTAKPATVFALTGRVAVRQEAALKERDPDRFIAWLRDAGVESVLLSHVHIQQWGLSPMLEARCRSFEVVRTFPTHAALLRLAASDSAPPSPEAAAAACEAIARWAGIDWIREVDEARIGIW